MKPHLDTFAHICKESKEYQGHGWGAVYLAGNQWKIIKNLDPIWTSDFDSFETARFLMVHARSAFRDQDICIENNMPFMDQRYSFAFNGELHGVRIKSEGRIGAEKLFNFIRRLNINREVNIAAFTKAVETVQRRTAYIRAMNMMMADVLTQKVYLCSLFHQDPEYFTLFVKRRSNGFIICSGKYPGESGWKTIPNNTIEVFQ